MFSIENQLYVFLNTVYGGVLIAFLYDIYRLFRMVKKPGKITTGIFDLLFWVIVAFISFNILFISNYAILRWYAFAGFIIGGAIYIKFLSRLIMKMLLYFLHSLNMAFNKLINVFKSIVKTFKMIINPPIRLINKSRILIRDSIKIKK